MRIFSKTMCLASVSVLVLGISPAQAFDDVDWKWDKQVTSIENITINVDDTFDISGLVEVEKIQMNVGDVNASSEVIGIINRPDGEVILPGPTVTITPQEIEVYGIYDAVDLPSVESTATAVGNNQSISSTVAVNLHDAQYNMGDIGLGDDTDIRYIPQDESFPPVEGTGQVLGDEDSEYNTHTELLAAIGLGAALGVIQQGEVSADSLVGRIINASVDSSATAVGNNLSVDLQAHTEGDAFLIADLTQLNYANVNATSTVRGVFVNGYANLGVLEGPLVSSVATAVGNNVSITVASPSVDGDI